jgi:hypothetical protein
MKKGDRIRQKNSPIEKAPEILESPGGSSENKPSGFLKKPTLKLYEINL